ncbi:MAG: response regulator [Cyclobacteriaceae bacterium]|nr:response regulator [Cyclobacteriaceae bacterium]
MRNKVLIVEDEALIAFSLKERLEGYGYSVSDIIDQGEDVLQSINRNCPDIILMDINLKGKMNGIETTRDIQQKKDIPVVFLTSYSNKSIIEEALEASPYGYVVKTIDDYNLNTTIKVTLRRHYKFREIYSKLKEDLREMNVKVKRANIEMGHFTYNLSHTIRGPIASMLGLVELFKKEPDNKQREDCLVMMKDVMLKLDNHIHNIIEFNECINSKIVIEKTDVKKIIENTINTLKHAPNFTKVQFIIEVERERVFYLDRQKISVLLKNLISNAIHFINNNGSNSYIKISVTTDVKGKVLIKVADNGLGIDESIQKKVFDMFYRGNERSKGEGLGLYIVREIVKKLNGEIWMNSSREKGTTIYAEIAPQVHASALYGKKRHKKTKD